VAVTCTPLRDGDVRTVWPWLEDHLRWHLQAWGRAVGRTWTEAALDAHIRDRRLVEAEWSQIHARADEPDVRVRVARADQAVVGLAFSQIRTDRYLGARLGVLSWLFVAPQHRGQGVGEVLMDDALGWMREEGVVGAEVFVTAENRAALGRYRAHGLTVVDHRMLVGLGGDPG